jgi:hypothetical protein
MYYALILFYWFDYKYFTKITLFNALNYFNPLDLDRCRKVMKACFQYFQHQSYFLKFSMIQINNVISIVE